MVAIRQAVSTIVMHEDATRVLMVRRSRVGAFPGSLVFPGGKIDPDDASDERATRFQGLAQLGTDERARRVAAARELHEETGLELTNLSAMWPLSRWITPEGLPYRVDTWFYILEAPTVQAPVADGREITELRWASPAELLEGHARGDTPLLLPTLAHVTRLAEFGERWREWPHDSRTSLEPIRSTTTRHGVDEIIDRIQDGFGFSALEHVMKIPR